MLYNITNREGVSTVSVFTDSGEVKVLPSTAATFSQLIEYLVTNSEHDEAEIERLINPALAIGSELAEITGDRVTYDSHRILLDGKPFDGFLGQHLADKIANGDKDYARFARFIVNLDANPSRRAREQLFSFLENKHLTITEEGNFIAYKGVKETGLSATTGVASYLIDGVRYNEEGAKVAIPNAIGTVVEVDRREVDDDYSNECSYGLHVGSYSYASGFSERLLTVEVNPADVVTVPMHARADKARVCRYKVIANGPEEEFTTTSYGAEEAEEHAEFDPFVEAEEHVEVEDESLLKWASLADAAAGDKRILRDLRNAKIGHKPFVAKWANDVNTTESSVRRWRKSNGVVLS